MTLPTFRDFIALFGPYICTFGYPLVFIGTVLENSFFLGFLMPGVVIVLLAGYYARSCLNLETVILLGVLGAFVGDVIDYWMGRLQGAWIVRFALVRHYQNRIQPLVKRFGGKIIFLGRFSAYLRGWVALSAGITKVPFARFVLYDVASALVWGTAWVTIGYIMGINEAILTRFFRGTEIFFWILVIGLIGWYGYKKRETWLRVVGTVRKDS